VTRYFDHIQSAPLVRTSADALAPAFPLVAFDFTDAPRLERKVEAPKKKEKAAAKEAENVAVAGTSKVAAVAAEPTAVPGEGKAQKKEKKEKKKDGAADEGGKKKGAAPAKAAAADDGEPVPSMIDLRVGRIVDSECDAKFGFSPPTTISSHETP
jgi:aminoacyl tRNA synthase complex-interacting multifunctional protein 1